MKRIWPPTGALAGAVLLHAGLAPYIMIGGAVPNMFLLVAVTIALVQGPRAGMIAGFAAGMLFDLAGTGPIGPGALVLCIVGFAAGSVAANTFSEGWSLPLVILFFAGVITEAGYALSLSVLGEGGWGLGGLIGVMLPGALYNVAVAVLVYPWLARFLREERSVTMFRRLS